MAKELKNGDEISFTAIMQSAGGPREISLEAKIISLSDIQNGTVEVDMLNGTSRKIRAETIVGYDREPVVGPVLFSADMVRSLRARRKTVTRRLATSPLRKRYAGDLLYVREAFRVAESLDDIKPSMLAPMLTKYFEADGIEDPKAGKLRPAMFMPRKYSRIMLEVINIRTERLQDITAEDAIEEGILPLIRAKNQLAAVSGRPLTGADCNVRYMNYDLSDPTDGFENPRESFRTLWESLHNKPGERWEDNPDIVRLEFVVHPKNIDEHLESLQNN